MKKIVFVGSFILTLLINGICGTVPEILKPQKISDNLYAIENPYGGNIAFLITEDGIIVVDAGSNPNNGMQIITSINSVSDKPIKYIIYTHLHGDHVYGISSFPADVKIIAHEKLVKNFKSITEPSLKNNIENVIPKYIESLKNNMDSITDKKSDEYLKLFDQYNQYSSYLENLKTIQIRYPDKTFAEKFEISLGNEKIILEYPGPGHTSDNIIVRFPKQNAIHTGDLIFNGSVPYVLAAHGATIKGWTAILEKLGNEEFKYVIPGHGKIAAIEIIKNQSNYFQKLTEKVSKLKTEGKSLDEIKALISIDEFGLKGNAGQFPVNIEVAYNEL